MSKKWPGGIITPTPITPTTSSAPGIWTLSQQAYWQKQGLWPSPPYFYMGILTGANSPGQCAVTSSGGMVVGGNYQPSTYGSNFAASISSKGVITWQSGIQQTSSPQNFYNVTGVWVDSSNNVYLTGGAGTSTSSNNVIVQKLNSSGVLQWQNMYRNTTNASSSSYGTAIVVDTSGNTYTAGYQYEPYSGYNGAILIKNDSSGVRQWSKHFYIDTATIQANGAAIDPAGPTIYMVGRRSDNYFWAAALSSTNAVSWSKVFRTAAGVQSYGQAAVFSGGYLYANGYYSPSGGSNGFLVKYDSSGTLQWQRRVGDASSTEIQFYAIAADSSGNIYCGGVVYVAGNLKGFIVKYNSSGTLLWQNTITRASNDVNITGLSVSGSNICFLGTTDGKFFVGSVPTDGSYTGTYTVGGYTLVYANSAISNGSLTVVNVGDENNANIATDGPSVLISSAFSNVSPTTTISTTAL